MTENAEKIFDMLNINPYQDFKIDGYDDKYYIVIDLIVFSIESNPKIVIPKAIIYLVISTTITGVG